MLRVKLTVPYACIAPLFYSMPCVSTYIRGDCVVTDCVVTGEGIEPLPWHASIAGLPAGTGAAATERSMHDQRRGRANIYDKGRGIFRGDTFSIVI